MATPFEILGLAEAANDEQVKTAYLKKIREFPPERFPEKFKEVRQAFEQVKSLRDRVAHRLFHREEPDLEQLLKALKRGPGKRIPSQALLEIIAQATRQKLTL